MSKEELEDAVTNLLSDLHAFNLLHERIVNMISTYFHVDAKEICRKWGITYNID